MFQVPLATSASPINKNEFWKAFMIYHNRPHIVNRRIAVADQILLYKVRFSEDKVFDISSVLTIHALSYEVQKLERIDNGTINQNFLLNLLGCYVKNVELYEEDVGSSGVYLSLRVVLPRMQKFGKSVELVVLDKEKDMATFLSTCTDKDKLNPLPMFPYRIELARENCLRIALNSFEDADTPCAEWLCDSLFKKLIGWTELKDEPTIHGSLRKISLQKYCEYYNHLKEKYGEPLRKIWWDKTKTNPQKFIYEDIAIASYLICLWKQEYNHCDMIEFVDCGCGNGLLVYILNEEGFKGYGLDLRKRSVWDLFSGSADLRVGTVNPSSRFPNATWLIGNHSDELTPWIPVIATKSSPLTNFFVLPCCPFDFNGKKFIRQNTSISQYADYMEYIKKVSEICGFETSVDKLKIPSTKRTCIIGIRKTNSLAPNSYIHEEIDNFLKSKLQLKDFEARLSTEKVRNCTQIDQKIKETIVTDTVKHLLKIENLILKDGGSKWNKGGVIPLGELSKLLNNDDLNHLKKECGGLQTLLKNHRYIFQIEEACVFLRMPYKLEETSKYKQKPCWYFRFHPDGCLYSDEICGYAHNK